MIFLDTDDHYFIAETRSEMVTALLAYIPDDPDDSTLAALTAACLGLADPLDVMVFEEE